MAIFARLTSIALFLCLAAPVLAAGTPYQTLLQYYEQARNEDLEKYYQLQHTADLDAAALAERKEITRELWRRFDTRESTVQNFRVVQENDLALARYNLVSILVGQGEGGDAILQQMKEYAAVFVHPAGDWKILQVSDARELDAGLQSIFRLRAGKELMAMAASLNGQAAPAPRPTGQTPVADFTETKKAGDVFSGIWKTTYGDLSLELTDGRLSGSYENKEGRLSGEVSSGNVVRGYWTELGNRCPEARDGRRSWGDFEFRFTDSGSFTGKWGYCGGDMSSAWNGQRKSIAVPFAATPRPDPKPEQEQKTPEVKPVAAPVQPFPSPPPAVRQKEPEKEPEIATPAVPAPEPPRPSPLTSPTPSPSPLAKAAERPRLPVADQEDIFSGVWATNYGQLSLQRNDGQITGTYSSNGGTISGVLEEGAVISGFWTENSRSNRCPTEREGRANWGKFEFHFTPDGTFSGRWGYCDKPLSGDWSGTLKSRPPVPVVSPSVLHDRPMTRWKLNSGELITLQHKGNSFEGTYAQDHGEVFGNTNDSRTFTGYWVEDMANERCREPMRGRYYWGTFTIVFNDDRTFAGKWGYCNGPKVHDWSGRGM